MLSWNLPDYHYYHYQIVFSKNKLESFSLSRFFLRSICRHFGCNAHLFIFGCKLPLDVLNFSCDSDHLSSTLDWFWRGVWHPWWKNISQDIWKEAASLILIVFQFLTFVSTVWNFRPLQIAQYTPNVFCASFEMISSSNGCSQWHLD